MILLIGLLSFIGCMYTCVMVICCYSIIHEKKGGIHEGTQRVSKGTQTDPLMSIAIISCPDGTYEIGK